MSRHVDDILAILDAGLQDSPEESYGADRAGVCWRCQRAEVADQSETCESCRLDLVVGPVHGPVRPPRRAVMGHEFRRELALTVSADSTAFAAQVTVVARACGLSLLDWQRAAIAAAAEPVRSQPLCTTEHGCPQPCDDSRCPSL